MIDEVNTARDVALLSINATLDGRLSPLPGGDRRDRRRPARVRGPARLQPGAGRRDRHPRRVALAVPRDARGHEQLGGARRSSARRAPLVAEAMRLDRQRIAGEDGLCWTPQFRDIESLWRMSERVGERAALAFFASNLHEQVSAGQDPGRRGGRRLPDARPGRLRPPAGLGVQRTAEPARLPAGGDLMTPATRTTGRGRRCSCSSCTALPRSAAASTPSTRTSPTTGRGSCSACTRCGR